MPRATTKRINAKKAKQEPEQILMSKEEVWSVLNFAQSIATGFMNGVINPELLSSRMKDVSYNPAQLTTAGLSAALSDPKNKENELRSFMEYMEIVSMPLKRILSYLSSQLAFDLTYVCLNAKDSSDYKSPAYKKDLDIVFDFLDRFNYEEFFRNITKQLLRNELYIGSIRDESEKIILQELPVQYAKITGRWDYGFLGSFNMYWFLVPGVDTRLYSPFFADKYNSIFENGKPRQIYNPDVSPLDRGVSSWVYWQDLPPEEGWIFKFDPSLTTSVPYFSGLLPDLINQDVMRNLQKNANIASASKLLVGQVPLLKEAKASVKDMIAIDPKTLGEFLGLIKSALSDAIKVTSAPLEQMQGIEYKGDNELYDSYLRTTVASSGMNSALFYSSKLKANAIESQLSFQSDSLLMEQALYPQFANFLNYNINRRTKKFKFGFNFEGNAYYLDRQQRYDYAIGLMERGIVLPQKIAAARGIKPHDFYRMMDESKGTDFVDSLTPIMLSSQMSPNASLDKGGRPQKPESKLSEAGSQTRTDGGNLEKGGKV